MFVEEKINNIIIEVKRTKLFKTLIGFANDFDKNSEILKKTSDYIIKFAQKCENNSELLGQNIKILTGYFMKEELWAQALDTNVLFLYQSLLRKGLSFRAYTNGRNEFSCTKIKQIIKTGNYFDFLC